MAKLTQIHNREYVENVKRSQKGKRGTSLGSKRTRKFQKKKFIADGTEYCCFCSKMIREGDIYVKDKKKRYHHSKSNSCYSRYKRVVANSRNSLRR